MSHLYRILDPIEHSAESSAQFHGKCALAVMAKAPVPGKVKTRLSPPLSPEQAAALNACFLRDTVQSLGEVCLNAPAEWVVSYTPEGHELAFNNILPRASLLLRQRGEDFGERLRYTAEDLFQCGFSAVCLIDSDSPTVPSAEFRRAVEELLLPGPRAVLGCSTDGGYYLIGVQQPHARLFEEIHWSTNTVSAQTLERAAELGLPVTLLATWYDVDDSHSLERLRNELLDPLTQLPRGYHAPHTRDHLLKVDVASAQTVLRSFS